MKNNTNTNTNTNINNNGLALINDKFVPESIELDRFGTIKAGESLLGNEYAYIEHTGDEKLDKAIDKLNKDAQLFTMTKIHVGFILEEIARDKLFAAKFKTIEDFYSHAKLAKNTANRWRAVARYMTITTVEETKTGKSKTVRKLADTSKIPESVIFAAYAVMNDKKVHLISADLLQTLCADGTIKNAKDLYAAYNRYISTLDTDEADKPAALDDNGKPVENDGNTVETTADSVTTDGTVKRNFALYGSTRVKTISIPEEFIENKQVLFDYLTKHGVDVCKAAGIDTTKENDAFITMLDNSSYILGFSIIQHKPAVKVITAIRDMTKDFGQGYTEKIDNDNNEK